MFETMAEFFISILLFLDSIVYSLISWVYQIILLLCQIDILDNSTEVEALMNRIYVIIGVVVMFLMAYSLLKSMVNPNIDMKDKKGPAIIIKEVIISIVLIALVPSIFSFASDFQRAILMENTIGKIILGTSSETTGETSSQTIEEGGIEIASNILQAFLHPVYSQCTQRDDYTYDCSEVEVATQNIISWVPVVGFFASIDGGYSNYDEIWETIKEDGNFLNITIFAYSLAHESTVTYYYLISTVVGIFVLLVLLSYCIDIAIRSVKLAVYQLLAPLPILSRILPGEQGRKVFDNWLKATISTYVEVFIRLAILFFAVLLIKIVVQNLPTLLFADALISGTAGFTVYLFAQLFIIVGIILFVKQAPGIIKEITGLDGNKYNVLKSAKQSIGLIGGAAMGRTPAAAIRAWEGAGEKGGLRSIGREYARRQARLSAKEEGAKWRHRTADSARKALGLPSLKDSYEDKLKSYYNPNTKEYFQAQNQSSDAIVDLNGNTIVNAGENISLNPENVRILSEQVALNNERKAEISERARQFKGANDSNQQYKSDEDNIKTKANSEIGTKNKYWVRADGSGKLLDLSFKDQKTGATVSSLLEGVHTATELKSWLEGAKANGIISNNDYSRLSQELETAITKHSVDSYINTNGEDWQSAAGAMLKLAETAHQQGVLTSTDYLDLQDKYIDSAIDSDADARQFIADARQKLITAGVNQQAVDNAAATSVESTLINNKAALLDQLKNDGINMIDANGQIVNYRGSVDQHGNIVMMDSNGNRLSQVISNMGLSIDIDRIANTAVADLSKKDISDLTDFIKDNIDGTFQARQMTLTREQSSIDNQNTLINNMIDQGKNQAESFRKSAPYIQADAASRANQAADQGKH